MHWLIQPLFWYVQPVGLCFLLLLVAGTTSNAQSIADAASAARVAAQQRGADNAVQPTVQAAAAPVIPASKPSVLAKADSLRNEAHGELMRLPPLADLLAVAQQNNPQNHRIAVAQAQEVAREKLWKLADFDLLSIQAVGIAGRRDVFAINTDGSVYVPTASVVDNLNAQASVLLRVNPVSFFQNGRRREIIRLERDRLAAVRDESEQSTAEGIVYAYNMAQKSLDVMDARAGALQLVESRAGLAEQQFRNGVMSLADYAEFQSKAADMAAKFQDSRGDFRLYYQMLMTRVYGKVP